MIGSRRACLFRQEVAMAYTCANPQCRFDYYSMRAICPEPACLQESQPGCGCYYRFQENGTAEKLPVPEVPPPDRENIAWLCCYCAMEYEVVGRNQLRIAPDPPGFIGRCIERAEASIAHEAG
jgi:hypothetical protein